MAKDDEQRIFRGKHESRFSIVPNALMEHRELSIGAKGLAVYLLSRPPNWHIRLKQLAMRLNVGRDRMRGMIRELMDAGYVERAQSRKAGTFGAMKYFVRDVASVPQPEKPATEKPATEKPTPVFQSAYKEQNVTKTDTKQVTSSSKKPCPNSPARASTVHQQRQIEGREILNELHEFNSRTSGAGRAAGLGREEAAWSERPEVTQARLAHRLGRGDVAQGWQLLGLMSETQINGWTSRERNRSLSDRDITLMRNSLLSAVKAAASQ